MKILILLAFFSSSLTATTLEGRFVEKNDKCRILINEMQLSNKKKLSVKCEMFLVDKYKYRFEIDDKTCPYKVRKVQIIAPGVDAKSFMEFDKLNECMD